MHPINILKLVGAAASIVMAIGAIINVVKNKPGPMRRGMVVVAVTGLYVGIIIPLSVFCRMPHHLFLILCLPLLVLFIWFMRLRRKW